MTVEEAKKYLRDNWEKGVKCPCCGRKVKLYKYKMDVGMALALIYMYRLQKAGKTEDGWVYIARVFPKEFGVNPNSLKYTLLKWWGLLISDRENDDPNKRASGYWVLPKKGIDFVENKIMVQQEVHVYDNKRVAFSGPMINIYDALRKKFSYDELMNG